MSENSFIHLHVQSTREPLNNNNNNVHHKKSLCNRVRQGSQNDWKNEVLCINQVDRLSEKAIHRDILVCPAERA